MRLFVGWATLALFLRPCDAGSRLPGGYIIIFCDNLFLQTLFWTLTNREKGPRDWSYLSWNFCTFFFPLYWNTEVSYVSDEEPKKDLVQPLSLAHGGLAVLPDWLWWFLLASSMCTVQYSLLMWCLRQNVQQKVVDCNRNMQKEGCHYTVPSLFQSWMVEIKCFYLFQVNDTVLNEFFLLADCCFPLCCTVKCVNACVCDLSLFSFPSSLFGTLVAMNL